VHLIQLQLEQEEQHLIQVLHHLLEIQEQVQYFQQLLLLVVVAEVEQEDLVIQVDLVAEAEEVVGLQEELQVQEILHQLVLLKEIQVD
jgi:hypothetical protein